MYICTCIEELTSFQYKYGLCRGFRVIGYLCCILFSRIHLLSCTVYSCTVPLSSAAPRPTEHNLDVGIPVEHHNLYIELKVLSGDQDQ